MLFLYPKMMFEKTIDPEFLDEFFVAATNHKVCVLKKDDISSYGGDAIYRGWMKTEQEYGDFYDSCLASGIKLINTLQQYVNTHYMHNWVDKIRQYTFETYCFDDVNSAEEFMTKNPGKYIVKNDIKFAGVAESVQEFRQCIQYIKKYQNGEMRNICLRKFYDLDINSEKRYFVYKGEAHSTNGHVPDIVECIIPKIDSNFYSVDVIDDFSGKSYIVEIGDGQVSGTKKWCLQKFYSIFEPTWYNESNKPE